MGLAEDLGYISPRVHITSTVSSLFVMMLFKVWVSKVGVPGFDAVIKFTPFAIFFTLFATVGVVNAFNLDGLNGLSSYISISIAASSICFDVGTRNSQFSRFSVLRYWGFQF